MCQRNTANLHTVRNLVSVFHAQTNSSINQVQTVLSHLKSVKENSLFSLWSPFKGIKVETTLIPIEGGHIRRHKVTSDYDCIARDAGFSVSCVDGAECTSFESNGVVTVKNNFSFCSVESTTGGTPEVV